MLIVMFIMLVPVMTHEVSIDLPPPGRATDVPATPHRLVMTRGGAVTLDGVGVSDAGLSERLTGLVRADGGTTVVLGPTRRRGTSGSIRCSRWSSGRG